MPRTHGNALAGALAAALLAVELKKLLSGDRAHLAAGREVLFDARCHAHSVSRLVRNPDCRLSHERWALRPMPDLSLGAALALAERAGDAPQLRVPEQAFVSRLACERCGHEEPCWRLEVSLDEDELRCPGCGCARQVRGFDLVERLSRQSVPGALLDRPLAELGLRPLEVFAVGASGAGPLHFVLDAEAPGANGSTATKVVAAGCGGNIGGFFCALAGRMEGVGPVVACDPDTYEPGQVAGQDMQPEDAGRNKAVVQAERLRKLRPELCVEAVEARVETLPLGALWGAVAVSCLDSLAARLRLARRAWWMGSPFLDAAVGGGDSLLVRTTVYLPERGAACAECALDPDDYTHLEQVMPCELARTEGDAWTTS